MKKTFLFIILLLTSILLGSLIASGCTDLSMFKWLSYSKTVGLDNVEIDLVILQLNFGCRLSINVAQLILLLISFFIYPKASKSFE